MANEDSLFGLTRRGFVLGTALAIGRARASSTTPGCTLIAEQESGPYYIDAANLRSDLTENKPGVPVRLRVALVNAKTCAPLENAALDVWHCDAAGVYSGFTAASPDGPPGGGRRGTGGPPHDGPPPDGPPPGGPGSPGGFGPPRTLDATRFLRGVQIANKEGIAEFETVYPGWYFGRAIHIHMKVHLGGHPEAQRYAGGHVSHTGQLFFPEDVTGSISKLQPYAKRLDVHRTLQSEDHIFLDQHGGDSMVILTRLEKRSDAAGFLATATLAVDPDALPAPVGFGPGRGRGPGPR